MNRRGFLLALLLTLLLAACQSEPSVETDQIEQLEARLSALESQQEEPPAFDLSAVEGRLDALEQSAASADGSDEATLDALEARLAALEARATGVADGVEEGASEGEAMHGADSTMLFQMALTTYQMDSAGFHEMDVAINEEGLIDPTYPGSVRAVHRLISVTAWPEALQPRVAAFQETLEALAEALEDDDLEAAGPLAAQAHEEQHDLSHEVEHFISSATGESGGGDH